ncbi:MAG: hypothetical protein QXV59_07380 [Nitrososphaerota archaeon]
MYRRLASLCTALIISIIFLAYIISIGYTVSQYTIDSNYIVPLTVNGVEVQPPVKVSEGDTICVKETIVYLLQNKRLIFRGWNDGVRDQCRVVKGNHTALYDLEVLLQIYAEPKALRKSEWVKAGTLVKLDYPEIYHEDRSVRYVFEMWSGGETPFQPNNVIFVSEPARLEARYVKEYFVEAVGLVKINGTGWYRDGEVAIIATKPVIYLSDEERLVFTGWESIGAVPVIISNPQNSIIVINVKGPYILRANYERQYRVEVTSPKGVLFKGWVKDGETIRIQADPIIQLLEDTRLRFVEWSLTDLPKVPDVTLQVHKPYNFTAIYVRQYYLSVDSQYGAAGEGWYDEGTFAVVRANPQPPSNVMINRKLVGYSGDCGYDCQHDNGVAMVKVDSPKSIRAIYTTEPNLLTIGIITGIGGALVAVYALTGKKKPEEAKLKLEEALERETKKEMVYSADPSRALFRCTECGAMVKGREKALKHVRKHSYKHPVMEYVALEEIAEPLDERTALLWTKGLKLRMTPPDQLTVKELVQPGDIIRYTEIPGRLRVESVEKHERFGLPVFTIVATPTDDSGVKPYRRYINDMVAQDGKIYCILEECDCQVYVETRAPRNREVERIAQTSRKT